MAPAAAGLTSFLIRFCADRALFDVVAESCKAGLQPLDFALVDCALAHVTETFVSCMRMRHYDSVAVSSDAWLRADVASANAR